MVAGDPVKAGYRGRTRMAETPCNVTGSTNLKFSRFAGGHRFGCAVPWPQLCRDPDPSTAGVAHVAQDDRLAVELELMAERLDRHGGGDGLLEPFAVAGVSAQHMA